MELENIKSVHKLFVYYKALGEKTFSQIEKDQLLFYSPNTCSNSIAVIVNHLSGNMLSRWTDFLTSDGEKPWRNRDLEFEDIISNRSEMLEVWEKGWNVLFQSIDSINVSNYNTIIYIRNEVYTIMEALHRQLAHYAYHVGQIVYIGKIVVAENWNSLSIKKNESVNYNQIKFEESKGKRHFTDNLL